MLRRNERTAAKAESSSWWYAVQSIIGDAALLGAFSPLQIFPSALLAVSGGPDSVALMYLARRWLILTRRDQRSISVATVDHKLRSASGSEAAFVAAQAETLGFTNVILTWEGEKPRSGIQAAARAARYDLMTQYCKEHGIAALVTGHTQDDQAETVLMRLRRGSGLDGLAAMAAVSARDGVALVRPLLGFSKARLLAYLRRGAILFVSDPSNENRSFERVRLRHTMSALAAAGITPRSLAKSSLRAARSREALDKIAWAFLGEHFLVSPLGQGSISRSAFEALPADLALRVMSHALALVSGTHKAPRMAKLERQLQALSAARSYATLGGCIIMALPGRLEFYREPGRMKPEVQYFAPCRELAWDGRFLLRFSGGKDSALRVAPLGKKGWEIYRLHMRGVAGPDAHFTKVNRLAAMTTPALWRDGCLVCAPLIGFATETVSGGLPPLAAELAPPLARFLKPARGTGGTALGKALPVPYL